LSGEKGGFTLTSYNEVVVVIFALIILGLWTSLRMDPAWKKPIHNVSRGLEK